MKQKKILLYACIEKNIGDDLFIYTICKRYPKVEFYISSSASYGDLKTLKNLHFRKTLKYWNRISGTNRSGKLVECGKRIYSCIMRLLYRDISTSVYIVGNAFKNIRYSGPNQILWLKERIDLTRRFYILSTNFGPYFAEQWRIDCKAVFKLVDDICFRDLYSYYLFSDIGNARYAPDAVLSLGRQRHKKNGYMLFSVIDASIKSRGEIINQVCESYEKSIASLIEYYVNNGKQVCIIGSNDKQDTPAIERIIKKINVEEQNIYIFNYDGSFCRLKEYYENAEIVIGTRLHTIILGWLYGIPVVPIIYDIKIKEMLKSYGYEGLSFDIQDMTYCTGNTIQRNIDKCHIEKLDMLICQSQKQFEMLDEWILN